MVVDHQRDRFEDLRLVEMLRQNVPRGRGNSAAIHEIIDQRQLLLRLMLPLHQWAEKWAKRAN